MRESSAAMMVTWGNVSRMLVDAAARNEEAPAVVETGGTMWYDELAARAAAIAEPCKISASGGVS
jgi:acyl-CoA synthetase (AMP-forming)/AMP-acid ligase II